MNAAPVLMAVAWLVATVGVPITFHGRALNLGFLAAVCLAVGAGLIDWRACKVVPSRVLLQAWGLGVLAFVVPALAHGLCARLWLSAGRGCAALAWFALLLAMGGARVKEPLAWAALALLVGNLAFALVSPWLPASFSAFEIVQHEFVRGTPRLRGLANSPAPAGVWALVGIGLAEALPRAGQRRLARALGLLEACASLSVALLAVPGFVAALLRRPSLRWLLVCAGAIASSTMLYFQPLELTLGGRRFVISQLHPNYASGGLGPAFMPQQTFALPGLTLRGHATAYGRLAERGLTCFVEHPLLGAGPGGFREACRVMAMNTFGEWTDRRDPHNQLGGVLAELGSVGAAFLVCAGLALRRGYRLRALSAWQRAVWVSLLICALGSEDLLTLPVLALLACQLEPRALGGGHPLLARRDGKITGKSR